ncbi:hypothetical protein I7860_29470 [Pseudomonas tolaasii]|uniref:hypothetical protein n=1 Tax=Pseudomonas tolaasii TaxID=29442 RepID=UPI001C5A4682|nr:hypothetical protein [Pseudomonas tolaasii]MBW1250801.1 hypothetical protein [Pseudomonas tolaasii]
MSAIKTSWASVGLLIAIGLTIVGVLHSCYSSARLSAELKLLREHRYHKYRLADERQATVGDIKNLAGTYSIVEESAHESADHPGVGCPRKFEIQTLVPVSPQQTITIKNSN